MVSIRVLGSLDAAIGRESIDVGGPRQRGVLALLLVARGEVVSVDRLVDDLWKGEPPPRALGALQAYVSNLRRVLEPNRPPRAPAEILVSRAPGYALRLATSAVDAWQFEADVRAAATIDDPIRRHTALDEALGLWRGPAFAEFTGEPWATAEAHRLDELRLSTRERRAAAALDAGDAIAAAADAEALTGEYPLREEGWRLLALARYTAGRQAEALSALRQARDVLAEELGIDPGPALIRLEADLRAQRIPVRQPEPARATVARNEPVDTAVFVGRKPELQALHAVASTPAHGGRSRAALVSGEAGSGKSTLLQRFRTELEADGWRVVVGRCPENDGAPPAWPWVELLRSLAGEVDPGEHRDTLAPLLDDRRGNATDPNAAFGRFLLHRAVATYLDTAARDRPLAIFLDDLHRGDAETLALLSSVTESSSVFTVVAYRPDEVGPQLEHTLAGIATSTQARIRLTGLNAVDAAQLVRAVSGVLPDGSTIEKLTERTGGNPFYLRESARLLGSEGELVATSEVPEGVRDVLRRRFARLPEVAVSILRLMAVIGRNAEVDVLLRAAEVDEDTVLDALDAGVVAGLLDEPGPGRVRFTHALVRDTLFGDLSRLRRSRWHLRVAEAVEAVRPGDVAALAHHFGECLSLATARRAADYAIAAGEQAERRFAHDRAAAFYLRAVAALDVLDSAGTVTQQSVASHVDLISRASKAYLASGANIPAREARDRAASLAAAAGRDDLIVAALTAWDAPTPWLNRIYGTVDDRLVDMIESALSTTELTPAQRCRLLVVLVEEVSGEQYEKAWAAATEAERLAREIGDPHVLGLALSSNLSLHDPTMTRSARDRLAAEMIVLGTEYNMPAIALIGHYVAMQAAAAFGEIELTVEHLDAATAIADRYQWRQAQGTNMSARGFVAHARGDLDEAEKCYATTNDIFVRHGATDATGTYAVALFSIRLTQGRVGELAPIMTAVATSAPDAVADPLAVALLAIGDTAGARAARQQLRPIRIDFFRSLFLAVRGLAVVGLGAHDEARTVYNELLAYAGQIGGASTGSVAIGPTDTILGDLAMLLGDTAVAAAHYEVAEQLAVRCGCPQWIDEAQRRLGH